jgi:hypothetical protein
VKPMINQKNPSGPPKEVRRLKDAPLSGCLPIRLVVLVMLRRGQLS